MLRCSLHLDFPVSMHLSGAHTARLCE